MHTIYVMNQIWLAFLTGLTTGGISCFAVQGGLLATSITNQPKESQKESLIYFLGSKLIAYTLLGAGLGSLGSYLTISSRAQGVLQIFAGIIMFLTVGKLLDLHPIFKKFVIQPPKAFYRLVRSTSKADTAFAPSLLGFSTVLIPCGITQGMMVLAVATGNPITGAAIMAAFTLGTSPVFFTLGMASRALLTNKKLTYLAAGIIAILGIVSINTGQALRGSSHTLQNYYKVIASDSETKPKQGLVASVNAEGKQEATIEVVTGGYKSKTTTLKAGVPVRLALVTNNTVGCSRAFTIPEYNISKILPETGIETVEFTPTKTGSLTYTCSMGMYTGKFAVVN